MTRKKKIPAPIVAIVVATSPLTGLAPIAPAQAAAFIKWHSDYGLAETVTRLKAVILPRGRGGHH